MPSRWTAKFIASIKEGQRTVRRSILVLFPDILGDVVWVEGCYWPVVEKLTMPQAHYSEFALFDTGFGLRDPHKMRILLEVDVHMSRFDLNTRGNSSRR